jgi:hypothetical protein
VTSPTPPPGQPPAPPPTGDAGTDDRVEVGLATLQPVKAVRSARKGTPGRWDPAGKVVTVQFNPTTVKLDRSNNPDTGGAGTKNQKRQYASVAPATLSFDLEFDTAEDSGPGGQPVDVRTRTQAVRQFIEPPTDDKGKAPPPVRFHWGKLIFVGIVTHLTEDIDFFARDGTPLRAKVSVTISEQNPEFERNAIGPGARDDEAGGSAPGPGGGGTGSVRRIEPALGGESAQQLAARIGGNPAAWRSLMNGLDSPLALPAGTPVQVGPEIDAEDGPGLATGFGPADAGPGLDPGASTVDELAAALASGAAGAPPAAGTDRVAGFALTAAGGTAAAAAAVLAARAAAAADAERAAFAAPPPPSPISPPPAAGARPDPRALSYGRAIPLRPRVGSAPAETPATGPVTGAPWERLPPAPAGRSAADRAQRSRDARPRTLRWRPGGECG